MADITVSYKGSTIAEVSASGTTTLGTSGKYCEDDISIAYVQPNPSSATDITITYGESTIAEVSASGTTTLETKGKYCTSNILLEYVRPSIQIITDDSIYLLRQLPYNSNAKTMQKIVGCSFAWNQLKANENANTYNGITKSSIGADGSITLTGTSSSNSRYAFGDMPAISGHKYLICANNKIVTKGVLVVLGNYSEIKNFSTTTSAFILNNTSYSYIRFGTGVSANVEYDIKFIPQCFDLTQMFGSTIADYIYALEQGTAGAGVSFFKNLFPKDYYPYDAGSIVSVKTSAHKMVGFNQWDEVWELGSINVNTGEDAVSTNTIRSKNHMRVVPNTTYYNKAPMNLNTIAYDANKQYLRRVHPIANRTYTIPEDVHYLRFYYGTSATPVTTYNHDICINISDASLNGTYQPYCVGNYALDSTIELRGLLKLDANNNLYYDGDEYTADGTVKRKYEYRAYASGDESLADAITDGTHTVAKLTTQTTETTTGYTAKQTCYPNGTEEFVDGRTVEIPVNAVADYEVTS